MKSRKSELPVVVPPSGGKMNHKQSRFKHLAPCLWRLIAAGRSGSGKTSLAYSLLTDFHKGCFKRLTIVARTAKLDHSYIQMKEWAELHLKQNDKEKQFVVTSVDEDALMGIFNEHARQVAKEKIQRKQVKSKEPLSGHLWIFDDVSDSPQLRSRNESILNRLFTTGRHSSQSVFLSIHALSAAGTLLRKNASCLCIFRISNRKEFEMLKDEYPHLLGKDECDEIYEAAVGKDAPPYSWLTILPHDHADSKMFYARFDKALVVESISSGNDESPMPSATFERHAASGPPPRS